MRKFARLAASALVAAGLITVAPAASAEAQTVATPYAAGAIGDTFECGGMVGRLWCKYFRQ